MDILNLIIKKRNKEELAKEEIEYFVKEYTSGNISDEDAANLIREIYDKGMTNKEIVYLTLSMAYSGKVLDLSDLGIVVDKHSTGGVGDKVTIILMPIIAAMGVPVAKMSGRGLGFTGGTADKLEAIPGYQTSLSIDKFKQNVKDIGISLITQTEDLAPADKKIYALRNEISCVDSTPLIASSIMSKKIAAGANKIVLDVTCGNGAFMKNLKDAEELSNIMSRIGIMAGRETICIITNMEEPLGYAVGNQLEIIETVECLRGNIPEDIKEVILELGSYILKLAGKGDNIEENKINIMNTINSGKAFDKFIELVKKQNGDVSYIKDTNKFEKAKYSIEIIVEEDGYVKELKAEEVGKIAMKLGAGRIKKEDRIDMQAGVLLNKKVGDYCRKGEILASLYTNDENKLENAENEFKKSIIIAKEKQEKPNMILEII